MLLSIVDRASLAYLRRKGFESRFVSTSAGRVHVLDARGTGSGPPVVVFHGICAAAVHFRDVLPRLLAASRRVIALDLPAHGFSDAPPTLDAAALRAGVHAAIDAVLDEPAVVYGNSLGGAAALQLAVERPDRVRGLLLNSPGGARVDPAALATFLRSFRFASRAEATEFVSKLHYRPPWYRWLVAGGVRAQFARPVLEGFLDRLGPDDLLEPDAIRAVQVPIVLLWGRADRLMPAEHLAFFREHLPPHHRFVDPEDFGHCPYFDRPAELAAHINALVRECA